ncbi:fimbria/pilus outer membrane usher protein [Acinetobacter baumannii]|uniref:fimbria/pilus outer membrane usher protein n=1 Tax=Acinetobacter baumannii TaxID=470 RepID=UPI0013A5792A|nr:fimbria/pilus outer membrane usher protein [Acinetobacter baumannii]
MKVRIGDLLFAGIFIIAAQSSFAVSNAPEVISEIQQDLYLNVELNQSAQSQIGHFLQKGQQLYIDQASLDSFFIYSNAPQIVVDQVTYTALDQIQGLSYQYDTLNQKISIQVPIELLNRQNKYKYKTIPAVSINPLQEKKGILVNYTAFAQQSNDQFSFNGWNELRYFGLFNGVFSLSANYQFQEDKLINNQILDTYWEKDFPNHLLRLRLGDTQSNALAWTRSTRLSGLSLSKNFALQPYKVTTPLMSFKGRVALPSQVDIIINGIKQASQKVVLGEFDIQTIPSISGAGAAQMIITDINGRQQVQNISLYRGNHLLAKGLNDWSINLGYPKLNYGISSFEYADDLAFNGSYRYGLNNTFTVEAHTELTKQLQQAGLGAVYQLGTRLGQINLSYTHSHTPEQQGQLLGMGYSWNSQLISLSYNGLRQFGNFNDIASVNNTTFASKSDQFYIGFNTQLGQFGGSYIQQKYMGEPNNRYALLNWSYILPRQMNLNLSYSRDLLNKENSYYISFNIPWANRNSTTVTAQRNNAQNQLNLNTIHSADQDQGGIGWQVSASHTEQYSQFQGQLDYLGRYGSVLLNLQHNISEQQNNTTANASLNGGFVVLKDALLAKRLTSGSFAIVSTDQIPNVPVRLENRLIGKTNRKGYLLLDNLNPYQHNNVAIDTLDLPINLKIEKTQQDAVPRQSSGIFIRFPIYKVKAVQLQAINSQGDNITVGTPVWSEKPTDQTQPMTIVAHEGMIYLDNVTSNTLYIGNQPTQCRIELPDIKTLSGYSDLGKILCQ